MLNRWLTADLKQFSENPNSTNNPQFSELIYATNLIGAEPALAMHGGGNTSIKGSVKTITGETVDALFVKASGVALENIDANGFVCADLAGLKKLRSVNALTDDQMAHEFRTRLLRQSTLLPSVETLMHAFLPARCIVHTHPESILCLTNRNNGTDAVAAALGNDVIVIPYANAGLALGCAVADAVLKPKNCVAVIVAHHGLITWGETPKDAYNATIDIVSKAEAYLQKIRKEASAQSGVSVETAQARYAKLSPVLRGLLSPQSGDMDNPQTRMILSPIIDKFVLDILDSKTAKDICCSAPLTPDYLIRTKAYPLFVGNPDCDDIVAFKEQLTKCIAAYSESYSAYMSKYSTRISGFDAAGFDLLPRVVMLPGLGVVCAGKDADSAAICHDITAQALRVKSLLKETGGTYCGLSEDHLFDMEFRGFQRAKVNVKDNLPLRGSVALVTGSAGAIGSGICDELLSQGCTVAVTDLAGAPLDAIVNDFTNVYGSRVLGIPLDVTDAASIAAAYAKTVQQFGGLDILVINAGLAHVSPLTDMDIDAFRKLERVNVDGTLLLLKETGRLLRTQNMGGDIVLISTKNVFAPGAKFGAYSATKAASHQLCRIASLEFADMNVRVNMVAPDAVFSRGDKKSGLWAKVGPDRMKARGLDEKGLEEYYRQRNLLKAHITANHVARTVLFFVTHQTPTTGATIPVDGGLPDATPR